MNLDVEIKQNTHNNKPVEIYICFELAFENQKRVRVTDFLRQIIPLWVSGKTERPCVISNAGIFDNQQI